MEVTQHDQLEADERRLRSWCGAITRTLMIAIIVGVACYLLGGAYAAATALGTFFMMMFFAASACVGGGAFGCRFRPGRAGRWASCASRNRSRNSDQ